MHFPDIVDSPHFDTFIKIRVSAAVHLWVLPSTFILVHQKTEHIYMAHSQVRWQISSQKRRNENSDLFIFTLVFKHGVRESRKQTKPKSPDNTRNLPKPKLGSDFDTVQFQAPWFRFFYMVQEILNRLVSPGTFWFYHELPGLSKTFWRIL